MSQCFHTRKKIESCVPATMPGGRLFLAAKPKRTLDRNGKRRKVKRGERREITGRMERKCDGENGIFTVIFIRGEKVKLFLAKGKKKIAERRTGCKAAQRERESKWKKEKGEKCQRGMER